MSINLRQFIEATLATEEGQEFFGLTKKVNKQTWFNNLLPGIEVCQKVIDFQPMDEEGNLARKLMGKNALEIMAKVSSSIESKKAATLEFEQDPEVGGVRVSFRGITPAVPTVDLKEEERTLPGETIPTPLEEQGEPIQGANGEVPEEMLKEMRSRLRLTPQDQSLKAIFRAILDGLWSRKVIMLTPINTDVNAHVHWHFVAQTRKQPWLGMMYETNTILQRARNLLTQRFLASEADWSWWLDSDMIAPFKDPAFFYDHKRLGVDPKFIPPQFTDVLAVDRLQKANKSIVGGVYHQRLAGKEARMVIQPHLRPKGAEDKLLVQELMRKGPQNRVIPVGYVATGCALIHRKVYEDIQKKFPELAPKQEGEPWDFFGHDVGRQGEDMHFCELAHKAGHQSFLDLGLWCGHVGNYAFFPPRQP